MVLGLGFRRFRPTGGCASLKSHHTRSRDPSSPRQFEYLLSPCLGLWRFFSLCIPSPTCLQSYLFQITVSGEAKALEYSMRRSFFFQKIYLSRVSLLSDVICFSLNSSLISNSSSILSISFWSTQEKSHGNSGPRPREEMNIYVEQRHTSTRSIFSVKVTPESIPTWGNVDYWTSVAATARLPE